MRATQKSREYWRTREDTQSIITEQTMDQFDAEVQTIYESMIAECEKEIQSFYQKYASSQNISIAEAKKRVSAMDVKAYEKEAERLVKTKELTAKAKEELKLYNATMKINRLRLLESNIGLHLVNGYSDLEKMIGQHLTDETIKEYERQAGILGKTIMDTETRAKSLANESFKNATFSERIWSNQTALRNALSTELMQGLIGGKSAATIATNIRKRFNVSGTEAKRLARTELVRCQTGAQIDSYKEHGWKEFEFLAYGARSCEICQSLNGKHYPIKDAMPAENMPPMHPNCRCRTAPYEDEDEYQRWLDSFENSGKTIDSTGENNIINVVKTLSAAARRYPVKDLDTNSHIALAEGQSVVGKPFAGKGTDKEIRVRYILESRYNIPADEWQKVSGKGYVVKNGKRVLAELHWYEADGEIYELKVKRYLDES